MISEKVAILDAGSQYGKVIDRRVRELQCCCELFPLDVKASELSSYKAIIISGGPNSFEDPNAPRCDPEILNLDIPILGVCYGMQWLNVIHGGKVGRGVVREDGQIEIQIDTNSKLFEGLEKKQKVLLTHGDGVTTPAADLVVIGESEHAVSAIQHKSKPFYGVQFHPEVDLTVNGKEIYKNFLFKIAGLTGNYDMENRLEKAIKEIREHAGDKKVVVLVSGGVDSSVCCALLYKALGPKKVVGIHIDTGFMRKNEGQLVKESLERGGFQLDVIDASEEFFNGVTEIDGKLTEKLKETIKPEEKRKIIGDTFIRVITKEISKLGIQDYYLAQGTLRPDLIESASILASSKADVIKTHHNDTALVREKRKEGLILEPLKDYHKDEVRELGRMLGLPEALVDRHPFPGPGLAIRILCLDNPFLTPEFEELEAILKEKYSDEKIIITLLPIKSVGVQGDGRTYSYVVGLSGEADWEKLFEIARDIPKRIHLINRVVYIFGKPVEKTLRSITKTHLTPDVVEQVRKADDIVNQALRQYNNGEVMKGLAQMPVILAPLSFDDAGKRSIVLRPFISNDFMTGIPAIPGEHFPLELLNQVVGSIVEEVEGISRVMYDLTLKPPGTTEWE